MVTNCRTCASVSGENPISPAAPIYGGRYWSVEHVWPTAMIGWIVLALRRHAEALHDLTSEEFSEMAQLLRGVTAALRKETRCLKEYVACFAEAEGFAHVHVHVVPRATDLAEELRGPKVFGLLGSAVEPAERGDVVRFCDAVREVMTVEMSS